MMDAKSAQSDSDKRTKMRQSYFAKGKDNGFVYGRDAAMERAALDAESKVSEGDTGQNPTAKGQPDPDSGNG